LEGSSCVRTITGSALGRVEPAVLIHGFHPLLISGIKLNVLNALWHDKSPAVLDCRLIR
jgi:hypothetical protein